jgi:hypothetical protein
VKVLCFPDKTVCRPLHLNGLQPDYEKKLDLKHELEWRLLRLARGGPHITPDDGVSVFQTPSVATIFSNPPALKTFLLPQQRLARSTSIRTADPCRNQRGARYAT